MGDLAVDTEVRGADGRYTAAFVEDWRIWGPCGGYVAAVAMRAFGAHSRFDRPATFSCHFLGVADFRDVDISVRTLRATKRAESMALTMTQDDNPILEAAAWTIGDVEGIEHAHGDPPDVPHHSDLKSIQELLSPEDLAEGPPFPFWLNFDERPIKWLDRDEWENRPASDPVWRHWVRFHPAARSDDLFVEAARLLVTVDVAMWPSASQAYARSELNYIAPSLDLAVAFHGLDDMGEWLLIDGHSPVARDGIVGGTGRIWSDDGRLLCSGVQSMLCRPAQRP